MNYCQSWFVIVVVVIDVVVVVVIVFVVINTSVTAYVITTSRLCLASITTSLNWVISGGWLYVKFNHLSFCSITIFIIFYLSISITAP